MTELFRAPELDQVDRQVVLDVHEMRQSMALELRAPRRWAGGLRRTSAARALQGSNTIEGYTVSTQDAVAAVDNEPPMSADDATWAEIVGYRRVLTYVLNVATTPGFVIDENVLRSMHFMLLEHELAKGPGRYRGGDVYVHDDHRGNVVYEGPPAARVPELMSALTQWTAADDPHDPLVKGAMAHLNLVMIHPFRDGNGRMARALQTALLARDDVVEPTFSSIEEWLGSNTPLYYDVLAAVGRGSWQPANDPALWVKFNLRAHHMQAQTVRRRFAEAEQQWDRIDDVVSEHRLPERIGHALFDAMQGVRVTRPSYRKVVDVEERTATRDLVRAAELNLLAPRGERRGRYYVAGAVLERLSSMQHSAREPLADPYPGLVAEIRRQRP